MNQRLVVYWDVNKSVCGKNRLESSPREITFIVYGCLCKSVRDDLVNNRAL